jgi:hypothetical protein
MTGRKPVPLQAGHISSTTSDFIGFISVRLRRRTTRAINYIFPKLRNQLRGVTLNNKVELNLVLIGSPAIEYLLYGVWR